MHPYFNTEENKEKLRKELSEWIGTTFVYNCAGFAQKHLKADCVSFPIQVYKDLGLIQNDFSTPDYISVNSPFNEFGRILNGINNIFGLVKIWEQKDGPLVKAGIMFGDVIVCMRGGNPHLLIYTDNNTCWHCWPQLNVSRYPFNRRIVHSTAKGVYRFYVQ